MLHLGQALTALLVASWPSISSAAPAPVSISRRQTVIPYPADDSFYTPPAGFADTAPGTILRNRTVDTAFLGLVPDPVDAWQLLYRTTAINGSAIATVTTVFKPSNPDLDKFVSFATAYDSATTESDPSYAYRLGSDGFNNIIDTAELLIIQGYLLQGYIVSSPDYEGPDAAFAAGPLEGMGVLDSMRAVMNFGSTLGLTTDTPAIAGHGYSGGAIATGWAASLQPTYAPELAIAGWAHGGTPANLTGVTVFIDDTEWSGFLGAAVAGLSMPSAYQAQLGPLEDEIFTAKGKEVLAFARSNGMEEDIIAYPFISLQTYELQTLGPAFFQNSAISEVFGDNLMGMTAAETPSAPTLIYHAAQDEIIPYLNASSLVDRYCARGASITFSTYEKGGHATTLFLGVPEVYAYINSVFAGGVAAGCSTKSYLTSDLSVIGLAVELEPIIAGLVALLGQEVISD